MNCNYLSVQEGTGEKAEGTNIDCTAKIAIDP
jgi:hypothetical protein